jgi:uncharacterized protein (TIGR02246 family)
MPRIPRTLILATCLLALPACGAPRFNPDDPAVMAVIDSLTQTAMAGAASVDADKVLSIAANDLTFVTGDVLLSGLEPIKARFRTTYSGLRKQQQTVIEKRVRLLTPDVALVIAVAEGTYTDKAGWTSPPVGIGTTIVFVRENGVWRARHAHQSIAF